MTVNKLFGPPAGTEGVIDPPSYEQVKDNGERYQRNSNGVGHENMQNMQNMRGITDIQGSRDGNVSQVFIDIEPATPTP